ncbi:MAG: M28 family peptidase [Bacteroidota bacterium]
MLSRFFLLICCILCSIKVFANEVSDTSLIRKHLTAITKTKGYRTHNNLDQLNYTAEYILNQLKPYADTVYYQYFKVKGLDYKNVIALFGSKNSKTIVVGAHYDVCGEQEGADDNASGVVGLLELARLMKGKTIPYRLELVAYSLEEPPYFDTKDMGSYIHAKSLSDNKVNVYGMISLEMIGFFNDKKKSQTYPIGILSLFYGNKGNYITLVKKIGAGKFSRKFSRRYKHNSSIKAKKFSGVPAFGIDLSDHLNYWHFGYSAMMITDTSFFRNKNYHEETDIMETLDIYRMGKVIDEVFNTLLTFK